MSRVILVVDDDLVLLQFLMGRLETEGYTVAIATDGEAALRALSEEKPDLVILDLMLPLLDGLSLCRRLRKDPETSRLPGMILSARSEDFDKVSGLDAGADDFMTKPVNAEELIARVKALLRRSSTSTVVNRIRAGGILLDLDKYTVSVKDREIKLTAKEFELLRTLMEAPGKVLRRQTLLEDVWRYLRDADFESRTVDVHIRRLREKLGEEGDHIVTVRGVGYRFDAPAEKLSVS